MDTHSTQQPDSGKAATASASHTQHQQPSFTGFLGEIFILIVGILALVGAYFAVTKWSETTTELNRDGTITLVRTSMWGFKKDKVTYDYKRDRWEQSTNDKPAIEVERVPHPVGYELTSSKEPGWFSSLFEKKE